MLQVFLLHQGNLYHLDVQLVPRNLAVLVDLVRPMVQEIQSVQVAHQDRVHLVHRQAPSFQVYLMEKIGVILI